MRRFVAEVFEWKNLSYRKDNLSYGIHQIDPLQEVHRIYFLDVGEGYGLFKRIKIKYQRQNPDVKVISML